MNASENFLPLIDSTDRGNNLVSTIKRLSTNSITRQLIPDSNAESLSSHKVGTGNKLKKVTIIDKPIIIDVECWKKYNTEILSREVAEELENSNLNDNIKKKKRKGETIACTCIII